MLYQGNCFTDQGNCFTDQDQEQEHQGTCLADEQDQDQKSIVIVCKDERDWINPKTGKPYSDFNMCDKKMITKKICIYLKIV